MHAAQYVAEIREALATADGWRQFEGTGRACVVCPCGTATGFVDKKEALQAYKDHGAGKPLAELVLLGHKDTQTGPAHNA